MLDETDLANMKLGTGEIRSAGFHTVTEARSKVKPLLADRITAALEAVQHGTAALCEQGRLIA